MGDIADQYENHIFDHCEESPSPKKKVMSTEIVVSKGSIRGLLEEKKDDFVQIMGGAKQADRFLMSAINTIANNPKLWGCSPASYQSCLLTVAVNNLNPSPQLGYVYFIPYKNKDKGVTELTFQFGYKGYKQMALRSGKIAALDFEAVHKEDEFDYSQGTNAFVNFKRSLAKDRGPVVATFACAQTPSGIATVSVMSIDEIYAVRDKSAGWKKGGDAAMFWKYYFDEMAAKTNLRRLHKKLYLGEAFDEAIQEEDARMQQIEAAEIVEAEV